MRIAIITDGIENQSGARSQIELARALAKRNDVSIFGNEEKSRKSLMEELNRASVSTISIAPCSSLKKIWRYLLYFNKSKYDIILSSATLSLFLPAALSKVPLVSTYHGTQRNVWENKLFIMHKLKIFLLPIDLLTNVFIWIKSLPIFLLSDSVIAISNFTKMEARSLYFRRAKKIYWGASAQSLMPNDNKKSNKKSRLVTIVSVSRITPYKGFHSLIEAFQKLNPDLNTHLIICGSHPQKNYLNYLKKIAGKRVKIILNAPDNILKTIYQRGDIYATCDKYLFFGMPVLEAATHGMPSVSLNFAAAGEVIKHGETGFIAKNIQELKEYLEILIKNKGLRKKFSKSAEKLAASFTWEKTAKAYEKVFREVLRKRAN